MKQETKKRKQLLKKLHRMTEMQSFNQSLFSTTAYRHGRKRPSDPTVKSMVGTGKDD